MCVCVYDWMDVYSMWVLPTMSSEIDDRMYSIDKLEELIIDYA